MIDCCADLQDLLRICNEGNAAGIFPEIKIVCRKDIDAIPVAVDGEITTDITLASGKKWVTLETSNVQGSYTATPEGDSDGYTYNHVLTLFLPRVSGTRNHVLSSMRGEYGVGFTDRNDTTLFMGNTQSGAEVKVTPQTEGKNGYAVEISWKSKDLLPEYQGAYIDPV